MFWNLSNVLQPLNVIKNIVNLAKTFDIPFPGEFISGYGYPGNGGN
jgi:hypothetical protein